MNTDQDSNSQNPTPTLAVGRRMIQFAGWVYKNMPHRLQMTGAWAMVLNCSGIVIQTLGFLVAAMLGAAIVPSTSATTPSTAITGTALVFFLLCLGAGLTFLGKKLTIEMAALFESETYKNALSLLNERKSKGEDIPPRLESELLIQSPRFMGRMLIPLLNAAPAASLGAIAFIAGLFIYPTLSIIIVFVLFIMLPFFLRFAVHSSKTSRRLKDRTRAFSESKRHLSKRWVHATSIDAELMGREIDAETGYNDYLNAYQDRLKLAPMLQFLSQLTLSAILVLVFVWYFIFEQSKLQDFSALLFYIITMRVFFFGVIALSNALSTTGTFHPYFSNYFKMATGEEIPDALGYRTDFETDLIE